MVLRSLRYGWLLWLLLGWAVDAQSDFGRVAFSVLNDADIVHISQIEFQTLNQELEVVSTFGLTQRTLLRQAQAGTLGRTVFLSNETPFSQTFFVTLIVDDLQVAFLLDGVLDKRHPVVLAPGSQRRLSMTFPRLERQGLHNFVLVAFYDVQEEGASLQGIFPPYADSVMVGAGAPQRVSLARPDDAAFVQGKSVQPSLKLPARGLTLSRERVPSDEASVLRSPLSATSGQTLAYFIHMRNGLPRNGTMDEFVLVALWDGVQIPVDAAADEPVARFFLPLNGLATIEAKLELPDAPGSHTLDILAIRNPYALQTSTGTLEVVNARLDVELH